MLIENNILLQIKNLSIWYKTFGGYLKVLNSINLFVREGERIGIVGETGCGKTTTMKSILQILPPGDYKNPNGQIYFNGEDILKMAPDKLMMMRSSEISMIFQDPNLALNPVFTIGTQIKDVIKYSSSYGEKLNKNTIEEQARKALKNVQLPDPERLMTNYPFQLSGGMRQRVCIAMAISSPRKLLIADEPGTSLDVTIQDQIMRLLNKVVEDNTTSYILITHSLGVAKEMTDRIYVMYAGTIVESAPSKNIFNNPIHPYTKGLLGSIPKISGGGIAKGIYGKLPSYLNPPDGCRFYPRCEQAMSVCAKEAPSLIKIKDDHFVACNLIEREV